MSFSRIAARLRLLVRDERGIALPTALFATIASLGLASAAVMSSVDVQQGTKRDNGSKSAIGAADAGANVAMQRLNQYAGELKGEDVCVNLNPTSGELEPGHTPVGEPGWCAPIEGEVGGAEYSYRVSAPGSGACSGHDVCIVSTGSANEVSRRVELGLDEGGVDIGGEDPSTVEKELEWAKLHEATQKEIEELEEQLGQAQQAASGGGGAAGLIGKDEITLSGNDEIGFGVATDGNLVTSGSVTICGDVQVGIGKEWTGTGGKTQCEGHTVSEGNLSLPEVSDFIPSDIASHNSNARLTMCSNGLPAECQKDTYNGKWTSTQPFNPVTRSINLSGSKTLTVGGGDYWICSLTLSGSQELIMAAGAHVRFFFDTPEHCGTTSQIAISGNSKVSATGYNQEIGDFSMPGFYLLGGLSWPSQIAISGTSSGNEFIVYAPKSDIALSGNASKGMIVGRRVTVSGTVKLEQDAGFEPPDEINPGVAGQEEVKTITEEKERKEEEEEKLKEEEDLWFAGHPPTEGTPTFSAQSYVECTGGASPAGALPNASC
jgi:hypothetical protein